MTFIKTTIQKRAITLFNTKANKFLLYGGSRCFAKGTLVKTDFGHVPIENIKQGDYVLSLNISNNKREYKKVLKTFHNTAEQSKQMIIFEFRNGSKIECTKSHELYFEGIWQSADRLAKRAMENSIWNKWEICHKQFRQAKNVRVEGFTRCKNNETCIGWSRIFENNGKIYRQDSNSKNSQISCSSIYTESREQALRESYRPLQNEQQSRQFGMVYNGRKYGSLYETRQAIKKQWNKEWLFNSYGKSGNRDKAEIQTENIHKRNACKGIWSKGSNYKRCDFKKELESRCINLNDIVSISYYDAKVKTYDLCVEDNHNYTVTRDNIIVHNSGKSFITIYAIIVIACKFPNSRHLIARFRFNHVKNSIWLDTLKKVLKLCFPLLKVHWNNQDYFITLPNGSQIWIGGLDDKDRSEKILGMEFLTIFVNEASQISYEAFTTLLTRLAQKCEGARNLLFVDENPPSKKHWTYKLFVQGIEPDNNTELANADSYASLKMNPADNVENISEEYLTLLNSLPERKRKRFLRGEFGDDNEGALWTDEMIALGRVYDAPPLRRIVVSIDPAVTSKDTSDETGIVVCGADFNNHLYVLEDCTGTYTPTEWAKESVRLFHKWEADRIIGEVNNGGDLIETVIRSVDKNIPYSGVHATRDKFTRAEPVSALYEQGKAHHVGEFPELELEMTSWEAKKGEKSPNRIDALVWGAFELNLTGQFEFAIK